MITGGRRAVIDLDDPDLMTEQLSYDRHEHV